MENLTDEHLRLLVIGLAKIAFVGGLAGALVVNFIFGGIYAVAEYFARKSLAAARIRAARSRATTAPVAVEKPGVFCHECGSLHIYDGDVCTVCGWHVQPGAA